MADEKVIKYDKERKENVFSNCRGGKNTALLRFTFTHPIVCAVDAYIKESCLHRSQPRAGTICATCTSNNTCSAVLTSSCGGTYRFEASRTNEVKRNQRIENRRSASEKRSAIRAEQLSKRVQKRHAKA